MHGAGLFNSSKMSKMSCLGWASSQVWTELIEPDPFIIQVENVNMITQSHLEIKRV